MPPENYTCKPGEDPSNPRTKGALVTIYKDDQSVYHLSQKDSKTVVDRPFMQGLLQKIGINDPRETTRIESGGFRHSQDRTLPGGEPNPYRDPLGLRDRLDRINAKFGQDGTLQSCKVISMDGDLEIKPVQAAPQSAPIPSAPLAAPGR